MAKYYILDDIDFNTIRIKKVYNITLLDIFPKVLEALICEYVHDGLEIKKKLIHHNS